MKKLLYILLTVLTLYAAGMYRYFPLLILFVMELFLLGVMVFQVWYFRRNLSVSLMGMAASACRGSEFWCRCRIQNAGRMPVGRFRIRIRYSYLQDGESTVKRLYGGSETGESRLQFGICPRYCGMVCLELEQLKVYDYLALFSASRKIRQELTVAAFPNSQPMRMEYPEALWQADTDSREQVVNGRGDGTGEIRQLREYRPEDSWRHIHWNQSARTGRLWIKEYEEETNGMAVLGLEMQKEHRNSLSDMDCFYRLLSSMVLGFLQQSVRLCVYWFDSEKGCVREMEIFSQEQHRELLLQLYQLSAAEEGGTQEKEMLLRRGELYGSFFLLDTGLGWYKNGKLFHQFSGENLEQEIEQRVFTL